jgi:hypothetical protein
MVDFLSVINNSIDSSYTQGDAIAGGSGDAAGFTDLAALPYPSGSQVRQAQIPSLRTGTARRNMVRWMLPETGIVEMYINPQSIKYNDKKHIPGVTRTRGGYVIQYWGEELSTISLTGTTGSSGVEGINVLYDVYRNEQVSMDALALAVQAANDKSNTDNMFNSAIGTNTNGGVLAATTGVGTDTFQDQINSLFQNGSIDPSTPRPTLASIAFQTEMYWSGWVFRGYFNSMSVDESADHLGLFNYTIEFTATQKRGLRLNYMPWHRSAVNGPSNSNPRFGTPYSFSTLSNPRPNRVGELQTLRGQPSPTVDQLLKSYRPL